ncbi:MAG: hypothetical protein IIX15_02790 [Clostridia bacterium]|nr:hypothetical protein [Clostridia bacterium]
MIHQHHFTFLRMLVWLLRDLSLRQYQAYEALFGFVIKKSLIFSQKNRFFRPKKTPLFKISLHIADIIETVMRKGDARHGAKHLLPQGKKAAHRRISRSRIAR